MPDPEFQSLVMEFTNCNANIAFEPDRELVCITVTGLLQGEFAFQIMQRIEETAKVAGWNFIWDLSESRIDTKFSALGELALASPEGASQARRARGEEVKTAWVVSTVADRWILESLSMEYPWPAEWAYFTRVADGLSWLTDASTGRRQQLG